MPRRLQNAWMIGSILAGALAGAPGLRAQTPNPQPASSQPADIQPGKSQVAPAASPSGAGTRERFPYPGETAPVAAPSSQPGAAEQPRTPPVQGPASKRFPYPGETTESGGTASSSSSAPAKGNGEPEQPSLGDAGSSGESTSSSSSSQASSSPSDSSSSSAGPPPSDSPFTEPDADVTPAPKKARKKLPPVPRQTPSERAEEDVRVAGFYLNDGNFRAAYGRAQDAVSLSDDDPEAHLVLAEAARRLGKLDEAQRHYKRCLDLDPLPKVRKTAEHALKEMSGGA